MKKKIVIVSILAVFALIAVSYSAVSLSIINRTSKESPLYKIRSTQTVREKITGVNAKLDGRVFFLPLKLMNKLELKNDVLPSGNDHCITKDCFTFNGQIPLCSKGASDSNTQTDVNNEATRSFYHWITLFCKDN